MGRGHGLTKGEVWDRLLDYYGFDWRDEAPPIPLSQKNITYHGLVQQDLLDKKRREVVRYREGDYFEFLAQAEHGGVRNYQRDLCDHNTGNSLIQAVDLIDHDNCWAREVKGVSLYKEVKLDDGQIPKYIILQVGEYFPKPPVISFDIFRHSVQGLIKDFSYRPLEDLVSEFSQNILYHISFPFSIIWHLYDLKKEGFTSRQDDIEKGSTYTRLLGSTLDRFMANPFQTIEDAGLDPDRYYIEGRVLPKGVCMEGQEITPYPSLVISDVGHSRFIEEARRRDLSPYLYILGAYGVNIQNLLVNGRKSHESYSTEKHSSEGDDTEEDTGFNATKFEITPKSSSEEVPF